MAKTPYYTKAEADAKNQSTFNSLREINGKLSFDTETEAQNYWASLTPEEQDAINLQEFAIETGTNAGVNRWDSSVSGGADFLRLFPPSSSQLGFNKYPALTNFISELNASSLADETLWGVGFLMSDGSIFTDSADYKYTKKYYRIAAGSYRFRIKMYGNAKAVFYNKDYSVIGFFSAQWSSLSTYDLIAPEGTEYVRTSFNGTDSDLPNIYLTNNEQISITDNPYQVAEVIKKDNKTTPVSASSVFGILRDIWKGSNADKPAFPVVSFVADDGRTGNDEWYIPMLDSKGIKGTFAVVSDWMETRADAFSTQRVKDLYALGHDIASHTVTHPRLADITLAEAEEELRKSKTDFLRIGINPNVFVAPFASRNTDVDKLVRKYYDYNFASGADANVSDGTITNYPPIDPYLLKRISFDASANGVSRLQICKDAVDVAVANGGFLSFMIHPHYDEYMEVGNPSGYEARRQELSDLIDYIKGLNIPILTAKQSLELYKNPVQIGNSRIDPKYYAIGMDGSETGNLF